MKCLILSIKSNTKKSGGNIYMCDDVIVNADFPFLIAHGPWGLPQHS